MEPLANGQRQSAREVAYALNTTPKTTGEQHHAHAWGRTVQVISSLALGWFEPVRGLTVVVAGHYGIQMVEAIERKLPVGAEVVPGGVHFRVWAPLRKAVEVVFCGDPASFQLQPEPSGYFSGLVQGARAKSLYKYRLDQQGEYPDPASRFQTQGPDYWSQVIDPAEFQWTDESWRGLTQRGRSFMRCISAPLPAQARGKQQCPNCHTLLRQGSPYWRSCQ